jgi:hypothetical protein
MFFLLFPSLQVNISMSNPDTPEKADCTEHCNLNHSVPIPTENYPTQVPARGEPGKTLYYVVFLVVVAKLICFV